MLEPCASDRFESPDYQVRGAVGVGPIPAAWLEMLAALEVELRPLPPPGRSPELQHES